MDERRRAVRFRDPVKVAYEVVLDPEVREQTKSLDISDRGIRFRLYERLKVGTLLRMFLELPYDAVPLKAEGVIKWVRNLDTSGLRQFEAGVELTYLPPDDFKRIEAFTVAAGAAPKPSTVHAT